MLITLPSRMASDHFFCSLRKRIFVALGGLFLAVFLVIYLFFGKEPEHSGDFIALHSIKHRDYGRIGGGPLSLDARLCSPFLAGVIEEIQIVGKNTRPDSKSRQSAFLIRLKKSGQEQEVASGQTLFLHYNGDKLCFSSQHTPLGIKPSDLDRQQPIIEIFNHASGSTEESIQLLVEGNSSTKEMVAERPYFAALEEGKWWGTDLFVQMYGSQSCKHLQGKQKIEVGGQAASHVCFVSQGDYLTWDGKEWRTTSLAEASEKAPLAYIKSIGQKGIEIQAWDEKGFSEIKVNLALQPCVRPAGKMETVLSLPRLRNNSQISCVMGKRRMILKKGDFVLKTGSGWHHVRPGQDMEACFKHQSKGDLFVFDGIEKEDGRATVKGRFFDGMRTVVQPFSMPIAVEKKKSVSSRKGSKLVRPR